MRLPSSRTILPPPSPKALISGMRKFVRTPPTFIIRFDSLGNPFCKTPISDVVPPISTTMAFSWPVSL